MRSIFPNSSHEGGARSLATLRKRRRDLRGGPELVSLHVKGYQQGVGFLDKADNLATAVQPAPSKIGHLRKLKNHPRRSANLW
jgi:hypothetical protein